jgi:hypothetical protein
MPGYMFYIWVWEKVFGRTEFALRASNIPWLLMAVVSLRRTPILAVSVVVSPFVLYYVSEFRPYIIQVAGAVVVFGCFIDAQRSEDSRWRKFLLGNLILCASSLTGVLWSAGALVAYLILHRQSLRQKSFWRDLLIALPVFLGLGAYYVHTLLLGQGAALLGGSIVLSIAACAYELTGLMGLGPGRIELRDNPRSVLDHTLSLAAGVTIFGIAYLIGFIAMVKRMPIWHLLLAGIGIALPLLILCSLVFLKDFRLLARHLAPLSVVLAFVMSKQLEVAICGKTAIRFNRILAVLVVGLCLWSAASLRFAGRHKKDAYKDAAKIARSVLHTGNEVWWAADGPTALYYGLSPDSENFHYIHPDKAMPDFSETGMIIMSKPDIVDPSGQLRKSLEDQDFRVIRNLQAFTVWQNTEQK